jgi:hypothetical protein
VSGPNYTFKQKFLNDFTIKNTAQQLYFLPSLAKTAKKFYNLNSVLIQQNQNKN